jgi:uncharacterized membrane protein YfcA
MTDSLLLILAAFLSSSLTAVLGLGGGMLLISFMSVFLPPAAVVPVHGVVQFASNASRGAFSPREIRRELLWPFLIGCLIGTLLGSRLVLQVPSAYLPIPLGTFILLMTWLPQIKKKLWFPGKFLSLGIVQAFLTLFVGATGPLNMPFLMRAGLTKDQLVVTAAAFMTIVHLVKIITFGLLGFTFAPYLGLMVWMVLAVIAGSYVGTKLRHKVPEQLFLKVFKLLISLLAVRMIVKALLPL